MDKLHISTLNCEGLQRSKDYIRTYLDNNSCDILALQETWHHDNNIDWFSTIHDNYMYVNRLISNYGNLQHTVLMNLF